MRGYHLAKLIVYPLSFHPLPGSLILPRSLGLQIDLEPLPALEDAGIARITRPEARDATG